MPKTLPETCSRCGMPGSFVRERDARGSVWYRGICEACRERQRKEHQAKHPEIKKRRSDLRKQWLARNPQKTRIYNARKLYGMSPEQFDSMLIESCGRCEICNSPFDPKRKEPFIDHDHESGCVRGMLCNDCNAVIGFARDNAETLRSAIGYLERNQSQTRKPYLVAVNSKE